jgi:hypothetical protein
VQSVLCVGGSAHRSSRVTGQFGKNHLGDRNEFLPTVHGFDDPGFPRGEPGKESGRLPGNYPDRRLLRHSS